MKPFVYSPLPVKSYYIPVSASCCARATEGLRNPVATWNLLWLSCPELDEMPNPKPGWWEPNRAIAKRLLTLAPEVREDEDLAEMLVKDPSTFLNWWEKEEHVLYRSYEACGEQKWVDTVSARAELAARNLLTKAPLIVRVGNVLKYNFGKVA